MNPRIFAVSVLSLLAQLATAQTAPPPETIFGNVTGLSCTGAGNPAFPGFIVYTFAFADSVKAQTGGGGSAGRPAFPDVTATKGLDDCTPLLFGAVAKGTHFTKVVLTVVAGSPAQPLLTLTLQDVILTSDRFTEDGADGNVRDLDEVITMSYAKISIVHVPSGKTFNWDVQKNSPF